MLSALSSSTTPSPPPSDPVKDVELATFMIDVIEASKVQPVIVDFWAPWCGPCKQLTPILEKLVRAAKGTLRLAKIDIDRNQQIAQQMGVQSVPAVFAFYQGRPVDGFMGALPEAQVKAWIDKLVKVTGAPGADGDGRVGGFGEAIKQAEEFLQNKDIPTAQSIYGDILDEDPANAEAYGGLLRCLIAMGDVDRAQEMLTRAPPDIAKHKALDAARTSLELAAQAKPGVSTAEFQAAIEKNPSDHQARFDLAMAYYVGGQREEAVNALLEIVQKQRSWNEDAARKQLVKFFEAFGATDPLTIASRKRLSSILFS